MELAVSTVLRVLIAAGLAAVYILISPRIPAFRDMFRGGPRPPSHPLPADDSSLLNRKRVKSATDW